MIMHDGLIEKRLEELKIEIMMLNDLLKKNPQECALMINAYRVLSAPPRTRLRYLGSDPFFVGKLIQKAARRNKHINEPGHMRREWTTVHVRLGQSGWRMYRMRLKDLATYGWNYMNIMKKEGMSV